MSENSINDFDYHILRAFCSKMSWKKKNIEQEVAFAQLENAPMDAVYRVKTSSSNDKWVWRTIEDLLSKADNKERELLGSVLEYSSKLATKRA